MCRKNIIDAYCRFVGRELDLPNRRRRQLLSGLKQELEERFSVAEALTEAQLLTEAGTPREAAQILAESVPPEERGRYRSRKRIFLRMAFVTLSLLIVLALCAIGYLFSNGGIVTIETTHYAGGIPEGFPVSGESGFVVRYYDE